MSKCIRHFSINQMRLQAASADVCLKSALHTGSSPSRLKKRRGDQRGSRNGSTQTRKVLLLQHIQRRSLLTSSLLSRLTEINSGTEENPALMFAKTFVIHFQLEAVRILILQHLIVGHFLINSKLYQLCASVL